MSICYAIRFRARLSDRTIKTVEDFADFVHREDLVLNAKNDPSDAYGVEPSFGHDMIFAGERFGDLHGFHIVDGILEFGVFASNLSWSHFDEDEDGVYPRPEFSRLDAILLALTKITCGAEGEVQGVIGYDQHEEPNGWPIIRCDDGALRMAFTPSSGGRGDEFYGFHHDNAFVTEVPAVLPPGFAKAANAKGYVLELDLKSLRDRLTAIEHSITGQPTSRRLI